MKKILFFAAVAAMVSLTSCQNDDLTIDAEQANGGLVFTASLENSTTRTAITNEGAAGYKISWEATDTISINGVKFVPTVDKTNPACATFTKASNETKADPTAPYTVYYPASIYEDSIATLPATQVYKADGNIAGILPMYAESSDLNLNFKNLCGLLKLTLKGTEKVQTITLTDDTKPLSGKFTVSGNAAVLDPAAEGGVTLDCGAEGVQLDATTGKTFYVAVPAGSYEKLRIEYSTLNSVKRANVKANGTATVARNMVYSFTQTPTFKADWFYFEAVEAGATIGMSATGDAPTVSLKYSTDDGTSWNDFTVGSTSVTLSNVGDRVYFKAGTANQSIATGATKYLSFTPTKNVNVGGNIMYLLNGETPGISFSAIFAFCSLFKDSKIFSASDLKLPATTMTRSCYQSMFEGCTALVNAPALPATTLEVGCYQYMFQGCTALVNAPALPATTMIGSCYTEMFKGCTALVNAPALPATTLAGNCYYAMFNGCTALVNAPELPATTMKSSCYQYMFNGCTALVNAPELPATTLYTKCYYAMFNGCTALVNAPTLPAATLVNLCYKEMFMNCSNLATVTMLATTIQDSNIRDWLKDAGSDASVTSRTVYVASGMVDAVKATVPSSPDWKTGVQVKP